MEEEQQWNQNDLACTFLLPLAVQSTNFLHTEQTSLHKSAKQKTVYDKPAQTSKTEDGP